MEQKLLRWAKTEGIKIFIFISGTGYLRIHIIILKKIYPTDLFKPYHRNKANAETICQSFTNSEMRIVIFKFLRHLAM